MKNIIYASLFLISIFLIAGCEVKEITPENVNPIASEIQSKYNQISAYEAKIYSIDKGENRFGLFAAIKPDKYKQIIQWEGNHFLPTVEFCNGNTRSIFTSDTMKTTISDVDCSIEVSSFFNVFDKIKKLANYKNTVKEIEISKEDYKEVAYFAPNRLTEPERWDIIAVSDNGYTFASRNFGNDRMPGYGIGAEGIEIQFTDENSNQVRLVFLKNSYQLLKSEIKYPNGQTEVSYYADLTLNDMNMGMDMPSEEYLKKMYE